MTRTFIVLGLLSFATRAQASVFTVNSDDDSINGVCDANHCSLREAIIAANSNPGPDAISFNILPAGLHTIGVGSELPHVLGTVNLDATTQPGYAPGQPVIRLDGASAGMSTGLVIEADACVVKGLAIFNFALNGVLIDSASNNDVVDNVIYDNDANGVTIHADSSGNEVLRNKIGTTAAGLLSGNAMNGVLVDGGASTSSIADNAIAGNGLAGVFVASGSRNAIRRNSIFSNGGLGIDLGLVGVTANDNLDPDTGANNLQNFPLLVSAQSDATTTTVVNARLHSAANTDYQVELFSSPSCDGSGYGEGRTYLGASLVSTSGLGQALIMGKTLPPVPVGSFITATATDPDGNTSELAYCQQVTAL